MRTGAVISAAKKSLRMEQYEQFADWKELTMAERAVLNFQRAGIRDIVVVTGYESGALEKSLHGYGVVFLKNDRYETGEMLDSAKIGFRYLQECCDRILFCPADIPFFTFETVEMLLKRKGKLVLPSCRNKAGHPALIHASLIPFILNYTGERGLKGALDAAGAEAEYVEVEDEGTTLKSNSEELLKRLERRHNTTLMRPHVKVTLMNQRPCFGPGTVTLLKQIDCLGSVREACEKSGISYSKGWSIIHAAEEGLGESIVDRRKGGQHGGTALVTEAGRELLRLYERFEQEVQKLAEEKYREIFLESDYFLKTIRRNSEV